MRPRRADRVRLRPVRAVWFAVSVALTMLAVVGAAGFVPTPSVAMADRADGAATAPAQVRDQERVQDRTPDAVAGTGWRPKPTELEFAQPHARSALPDPPTEAAQHFYPPPPAGSGSGRRVVFDLSAQRVWLVSAGDSTRRSYLVSGSVTDNLDLGHFEVYSRSAHATSYDYSSTMRWMVRFTEGDTAAIGFHAIPRDSDGNLVQSVQQLGTPMSHGCIRQRLRDAKALWHFAPLGTPVVVVA